MKTIKSLLLTFMLLLCLTAQAQWAGEDKVVLRELDNSQTVSIGVQGNSSDMCYEWSGPNILGNANSSQVTVNPQDAEQTYVCTRTSSCGVEQDQVIVRVRDNIEIVSVTPLKNCYNTGDDIPISDFEIQTDPPGYESLATHTPNRARNSWEWVGTDDTQEITFSLIHNGHESHKVVSVNVFNDELAVSHGNSINFKALLKRLESVKYVLNKAKSVSDKLNDLGKKVQGFTVSCEPDVNFNVEISDDDEQDIHACCNGEEVDGYAVAASNSVSAEIAIDCYIPIQLNLPKIAEVYAHVGASAGVSIGPFIYTYLGPECSSTTVRIAVYATISGGVQLRIVSEKVLTGQLDLVGRGDMSWDWIIGEEIDWHPINVSLSIVGNVTFFNFFTEQINYPLFSHQFFN